jgi:viologen exporter family transport system permease protein
MQTPGLSQPIAPRIAAYAAIAGMVTKSFLAYSWSALFRVNQNLISMVVFVFFWRAVYANTASLAGLALETTLAYILLARIFQPLAEFNMINEFGYHLSEGGIVHVLLRPLDVQLSYYVTALATLATALVRHLPLALVATIFFGLRWPADPAVWAVFILSAILGRSVLFCLDWIFGCLTFYTTEIWGLYIVVSALALVLTGGLVPLDMMPDWLRHIVQSTPFSQAIYVPVSLLSGLTPLADAPRLLLGQALWLAGMLVLSRLVFRLAIRTVTVQGG